MQSQSPVELTFTEMNRLLHCVANYPKDGIIFRKSDMQLAAHSDSGHLNENKSKSRASSHIHLYENIHASSFNGEVLTMAKIIKFFMSSVAES